MKCLKMHPAMLTAAIAAGLSTGGSAGAAILVSQGTDAHISGRCSLREAIQSANDWASPPDTDCEAGVAGGSQINLPYDRIELVQGSLEPNGGIAITGTASTGRTLITRAATAGAFPIIHSKPVFSDLAIRLDHVQISGGIGSADGGGGILAEGVFTLVDSVVSGNTCSGDGGGIRTHQSLTLRSSTVSDNEATGGGGGIASRKYVHLIDSTVAYNTSQGPGGGISVAGFAGVLASNSTIAGNATHADGGHGGAIFVGPGAIAMLSNSTVTHNSVNSNSSGGAIYVDPQPPISDYDRLTMTSTLVTKNLGGKYEENLAAGMALTVTGVRDLIGISSAEITVPVDTLNCDAGVSALGLHGGPTETIALSEQSCAIDQGTSLGLANDQRGPGYPRVDGITADIGAFEVSDVIFANGFDAAGSSPEGD
ncbi:MAG: right-handed parallel beta-helix repeat-containing protein [Rhodanobacteraceae bacterium]